MNFFKMMQTIDKYNLQYEADKTFNNLKVCVETICPEVVGKGNRVGIDIMKNWLKSSLELQRMYQLRGVEKSISTIRNQVAYYSDLLVSCFMPADILMEVFLGNDTKRLSDIDKRILALSYANYSLSDIAVDLTPILKYSDSMSDLDSDKMETALSFLKSVDRRCALEKYDMTDKRTLATLASVLNEPLLQERVYQYYDQDGEQKESKRIVFNSDKMELILKLKEVEPLATNIVGASPEQINRKEDVPYRTMDMADFWKIVDEYIGEASPADFSGSGKTLDKCTKFVDIFTDKIKLRQFLNQFNRYDLSAALDQYRK